MATPPSSSTLVPINENKPDLRTRRRRSRQQRRDELCGPVDRVGGRFSALVDLPGEEEKPSSHLTDGSYGPSLPKEDLLAEEEKPSSDLADGQSQPKDVPKPSWDTNHVVAWRDLDLPTPVYVRMDRSGDFHTYPPLGGPFRNVHDVQSAIDIHARGNSIHTSQDLPYKESVIRKYLYWPDGTRKVSTWCQIAERELQKVQNLVKAVLDKRNDDDDQGRADEIKDIVHWQSICEGVDKWYYHLNITVKTKGAADDDAGGANLFFAEITRDQNDTPAYYLSSFLRVNDGDKVFCHGCINNRSTDMKHPHAHLFNGGHANVYFPPGFGPCNGKEWREPHNTEDDEELIKDEEDRIRASFDYLDDEAFLESLHRKRRARSLRRKQESS